MAVAKVLSGGMACASGSAKSFVDDRLKVAGLLESSSSPF